MPVLGAGLNMGLILLFSEYTNSGLVEAKPRVYIMVKYQN